MNFEVLPGTEISNACRAAADLARTSGQQVTFTFNDVVVNIQPGENAEAVVARWSADTEAKRKAWIESPEYKAQQEKMAEEYRQKSSASMKESAQTEEEMRDAKVPWPYTKEQLAEYIDSLVTRTHDYGTAVYAISMAATAAFHYACHVVGSSGFQASCADLDVIRRTRNIDGPFIFIQAHDALYPQYDLREKLNEAMEKWKPWLAEQAKGRLNEEINAHPDVIQHWNDLASTAK